MQHGVPPTAGQILISTEPGKGGYFDQSVVLLLDHNDSGSIGVCLQQPSTLGMVEPLAHFQEYLSPPATLFEGGPVSQQAAVALAQVSDPDEEPPGWKPLFSGVGILDLETPVELVAGMSFQQAYAHMDEWVLAALEQLGIKAWYQPLNDITSAAGKIAGAAQARRGKAVLHHVTMAYDIDTSKMLEVLRIGREKLSDKGTASAAKRVDPLRSQTGLSRAQVVTSMIDTFRARHGLVSDELTARERQLATDLAESKFATGAWTGVVP